MRGLKAKAALHTLDQLAERLGAVEARLAALEPIATGEPNMACKKCMDTGVVTRISHGRFQYANPCTCRIGELVGWQPMNNQDAP